MNFLSNSKLQKKLQKMEFETYKKKVLKIKKKLVSFFVQWAHFYSFLLVDYASNTKPLDGIVISSYLNWGG